MTTPKSATRSKSRTLRVASVEGEPGKALWAFPLAGGAFAGTRKLVGAIQAKIQLEAGDGAPELRTQVAQLFASAGIETRTPPDFRAWLWLHYVVTAAMIAEAIRCGQGAAGVIDSVSRSAQASHLAKEMMRVVYARGVDPRVEREESTLGRIPGLLAGIVIKGMAHRNPATRRMMLAGGEPRYLGRRLQVATENSPHRIGGAGSIDHIAVPEAAQVIRTDRVVAATELGRRVSDHDAYVTDVTTS